MPSYCYGVLNTLPGFLVDADCMGDIDPGPDLLLLLTLFLIFFYYEYSYWSPLSMFILLLGNEDSSPGGFWDGRVFIVWTDTPILLVPLLLNEDLGGDLRTEWWEDFSNYENPYP